MAFHRQRWLKRIVSVVIGLAVVGGLGWLVVQKVTHSEPTPSSSSSPSSDLSQNHSVPSSVPTPSTGTQDEEESTAEDHFTSCRDSMSSDTYRELVQRVEAYELVWLSGDTTQKQTEMDQYGTTRYLKANKVFIDPRLDMQSPPYELDPKQSSFTCSQNLDGSTRVALIPVVRAYQLQGTQKEYVSDWTTFPLHTSDWKRVDNLWKIDAER